MLLTLLSMVAPVITHAEEEQPTVLKVAFSQIPGIMELTEDGRRKGIAVLRRMWIAIKYRDYKKINLSLIQPK